MAGSNDPRLVSSKALAKVQDVEARLNAIVPNMGPEAPSIMYSGGNTVVTQSGAGTFTWTCPAGVTSVMVECWGAGAGGDGGSATAGGAGGGGGEYTAEEAYAVVPGVVYQYLVGGGGQGGTSGNDAADGGFSGFDLGGGPFGTFGVSADGGHGSTDGITGGQGGNGSVQSGEFTGGNGGNTSSTGGSGAGSSASPSASGSNGTSSATSAGAVGGSGGTDKGAGGAGGAAGASGSAGSGPGGGGGGAGAATPTGQFSKDYQPTISGSYDGSDAAGGNANIRHNISSNGDGTLYQGGTKSSGGAYNGTMKSLFVLPANITSDLAGGTVDKILLRLLNQGSWYQGGAVVVLGYTAFTGLGTTWTASGITAVKQYWVKKNVQSVEDLSSTGLGAALVSGAAQSLSLGPGGAYDPNNYSHYFGASGTQTGKCPDLHIEWHTGTTPVSGGDGADGRVRITYSTAGTFVAAVQPIAGTDDSGNAFAAGYTGTVQAVQPGTSPTVVEGWHSFAPLNTGFNISGTSWNNDTPYADYKLLPDGSIKIRALINVAINGGPGGNAWKQLTSTALPIGYRPPSVGRYFAVVWSQQSLSAGSNNNGGGGVIYPSGQIWVSGGASNASAVTFLAFEVTVDLS